MHGGRGKMQMTQRGRRDQFGSLALMRSWKLEQTNMARCYRLHTAAVPFCEGIACRRERMIHC